MDSRRLLPSFRNPGDHSGSCRSLFGALGSYLEIIMGALGTSEKRMSEMRLCFTACEEVLLACH